MCGKYSVVQMGIMAWCLGKCCPSCRLQTSPNSHTSNESVLTEDEVKFGVIDGFVFTLSIQQLASVIIIAVRKLLKYCGTTIPYPMWNHFPNLYYKVEIFAKKCGTIITIHTKYYGKPSGTIMVPLVNVEPFSKFILNSLMNQVEPKWFYMWNQCGSTCGTIFPTQKVILHCIAPLYSVVWLSG